MDPKSHNTAQEGPEMFYSNYSLFPDRLRGLAAASQFQWTSVQLRHREGTILQMRISCNDDLQNKESKLQKH